MSGYFVGAVVALGGAAIVAVNVVGAISDRRALRRRGRL